MTDISIYANRWNDKKINEEAIKFLAKHPDYNEIPIQIADIIDLDLKMNIAPLPGLRNLIEGSDAFLSLDKSTIWVDEYISEKQVNRYRFTLAHEVGHMVLHPEIYEVLDFSSTQAAICSILSIPKKVRNDLEWQADEFAGRVLVPQMELKNSFKEEKERAEIRVHEDMPGLNNINFARAVEISFTTELSNIFEVSQASMGVRLRKEGLIPKGYPKYS